MKNMRKILSLVLAFVMVLSLSVTAFAAETGTATIKVYDEGALVDTLTVAAGTTVYDALEAAEVSSSNITYVDWVDVTGTPNTHTPHHALTIINETVGYAGTSEDLADEELQSSNQLDELIDAVSNNVSDTAVIDSNADKNKFLCGEQLTTFDVNGNGNANDAQNGNTDDTQNNTPGDDQNGDANEVQNDNASNAQNNTSEDDQNSDANEVLISGSGSDKDSRIIDEQSDADDDNETDSTDDQDDTSQRFLTDISILTQQKVAVPDFTFNQDVKNYSIKIADGSAQKQTSWTFSFSSIEENMFIGFRIDGSKLTGQYKNDRKVSTNPTKIAATALKTATLTHGEPHVFSVIVGQKYDSNGDGYINGLDDYQLYEQYDFTIQLLPSFDEFKVSGNGISLDLSPTFNVHATPYVNDFYTSTSDSTITINSLKFASAQGVKLYVGDDEYTSDLSNVSIYLDKFTPENSCIAEIPFLLKYDDGTTSYQRTITLHVERSSNLPIISNTLSDIECDKNTEQILNIFVENSENCALSYQWRCGTAIGNLKDIPNANQAFYSVPTDCAGVLYYDCVVTNTVDGTAYSANSNTAKVTVNLTYVNEPVILKQPGTYSLSEPEDTYRTEYNQGEKFDPMYIQMQQPESGTEYSFEFYYNASETTEGSIKIEGKVQQKTSNNDGIEYVFNPTDSLLVGKNYVYCMVTATSTEDPTMRATTTSTFVQLNINKLGLFTNGSGTTDDPYIIENANDLAVIQEAVSSGNSMVGVSFRIDTDITLPTDWGMIGTSTTPFAGTIDGNDKLLTVPVDGLPLLGYVNGATVKNLNIRGERIAGAGLVNCFTGVGLSGTAIVIENVTLKSDSTTLKSGLVASTGGNGFAHASAEFVVIIRNCTVEEGVTIGYDKEQNHIGSFAGRINGTIEDCTSNAIVYGKHYVGGILGTRDNAMGKCEVKNCVFGGTVEASGSYAGGIVGGGYDNETAPNGACPTIVACTVTGNVKGGDCVGGIFGGDGYVAQTWDNVTGSISANTFTGKVSGNKYVGAIIGYRNSLNKYDNISGNTYSGEYVGIGFVKYLDTSYTGPKKMEGTIVINTGNGTEGLPYVKGCSWRPNHNRTDDPLGVDAEKLCKKIVIETPTCYELVVSGTYKTEYTVGEELNLTGIKLTAKWTAGKADTTLNLSDVDVSGYDKNKAGEQTITLSYGSAKAYIKVNVTPKSSKITVSVTIMGDSKHGNNGEIHGLARGGLTTWASASVEADTTNTVWNVLQKVMDDKGITYSADDDNQYGTIYISAVNGLAEFNNGPNSGWMYTLNGVRPEVGVNAKYVSNNDKIVLFYTDDYTYETGGVNYGKPVGQVAAEAVDKLIEAIGTVSFTDACKDKIDAARKAYNALSESEKKLVKKLSTLEAAEKKYAELKKADDQKKATAVDNLIAAIGTVTKNSGSKINAAWNAYNALTADQKALVKKLATLQSATSTWNDLMAKEVIDLIEKIGDPVTESSEKAIKDARTAYDKLTNAQKKLVTNYEKLTKAETELAKLVATEDDKKKAQEVIDMIDKLGNITADSEKDVEAARKAYDALTDLQKKLVENYDKLEAAESKLKLLKAMGKVTDPYIATGDYMINLGTPSVGSIGGEWMVIGLLRADRNVPNLSDYYDSVLKYVEENIDEHERLHSAKSTDNSRIILALTAMGKDVTKVGTHNLLAGLNSMDYIKKQGNNGPIWALIALDSGNYPVPEGDVTRQALIDEILRVQTSDGGWAISGDEADADMTGMALTALARYYKKDLRVLAAVDKAIECLSQMQDANGGFSTFSGNGGKVATSESTAQVVVALTALGINPDTDARFVKNGHSAIDALVSYFVNGGGFKHVSNGQLDGMATEQAYYALTAYYRFLEEKTSLYDMTDVIDMGGDPEEVVEETTEPTVPATTEPVGAENGGSFPWAIMVLVLAAGFGGGIATVTLILPRIKKKRF